MTTTTSLRSHANGGCSIEPDPVAGLVLTACGPLGDDDEDPTATAETVAQPTTEGDRGSRGNARRPVALPVPSPRRSSPGLHQGHTDFTHRGCAGGHAAGWTKPAWIATPAHRRWRTGVAGRHVRSRRPVTNPRRLVRPRRRSLVRTAPPALPRLAMAARQHRDRRRALRHGATRNIPFFVAEEATPRTAPARRHAAVGSWRTSSHCPFRAASRTVCQPVSMAMQTVRSLTTTDVNFRTGPGADCDPLWRWPASAQNIPVTILAAPVVREGEEEFVVGSGPDQRTKPGGWSRSVLEPAA